MKLIRHKIPTPTALDVSAWDSATSCCRNIKTIARLLEICGQHRMSEPLDPDLICRASGMLVEEINTLLKLLNRLREELGRTSRGG